MLYTFLHYITKGRTDRGAERERDREGARERGTDMGVGREGQMGGRDRGTERGQGERDRWGAGREQTVSSMPQYPTAGTSCNGSKVALKKNNKGKAI